MTIGPLLTVDWAPKPDEGDKVLFIFDGGTLTADELSAVTFRDGEIAEWAFVEDRQLDELTIPRLARRLRATMEARKQTRTAYLEEGSVPAGT